jgi:predicted dehydrogenase
MIHSRHSPYYDQRVCVVCKKKTFEMDNESVSAGTKFQDRYRDSYIMQLKDFAQRIVTKQFAPNVSLEHALFIERLISACDESSKSGETIQLQTFGERGG